MSVATLNGERLHSMSTARAAFPISVTLLIFATVFQKLAVPGFGGLLSMCLPIALGSLAFAAMRGVVTIDVRSTALFLTFASLALLTVALSQSTHVSLPSLMLLLLVQSILVFRFVAGSVEYEAVLSFVSDLCLILSVGGVLQIAAQSAFGSGVAFYLDNNLPLSVSLRGYNALNPIEWDVAVYKSNGIFFAEPSLFSQFLAIGILAEFARRARVWRILLMFAGMVTSYSGTGLMTIALFGPFLMAPQHRFRLIFGALLLAGPLILFADVLRLEAITSRIAEFTAPGSSGHARFVAILSLIDRVTFADPLTFLFGRGPGTVTEFYATQPFETFDPTWGKLFYEYGALGTVAYVAFFYAAAMRHRTSLAAPMAFTYFLLGGYLVDASIITQLAVLAALPASERG